MENPKQSLNAFEIQHLFIHQLNRVNCTKGYLIRNLPILKEIASFNTMKMAIQEDLEDVKKQQQRIDEIYDMLNTAASDEGCEVIKCVMEEAFNLGNSANKSTIINDMDIILYMQLIENIELISFRMLKQIAGYLNNPEVGQKVIECCDENIDNDRLFMLITEEYLEQKLPER